MKKIFLISSIIFLSIAGSVKAIIPSGHPRPCPDHSIFGVDFAQTNDFQGTWQMGGSEGVRVILSGLMNTNIELSGASSRDFRKNKVSSEKGFEIRRDASRIGLDLDARREGGRV